MAADNSTVKTFVSNVYKKSMPGDTTHLIGITINGVSHNLSFPDAELLCVDLLWAIRCRCLSNDPSLNPFLQKFRDLLSRLGLQPEASSLPIDSLVEAISNRLSD